MMEDENVSSLSDDLLTVSRSLFDRGLTPGTTGNLSVRTDTGFLITPTGRCMGRLRSEDLANIDVDGTVLEGPNPSKELGLHLAAYRLDPRRSAIVHLHSPYATAVSCLTGVDPDRALGSLTGYHALKVGRLALVPYHPPGSVELVAAVEAGLAHADAALLANHGLLVGGPDLESAADAAEQIEQSAHIYFLIGGRSVNPIGTVSDGRQEQEVSTP
jgi:3-dehydro-4-phosphotetronate decarboxylase